MPDIVIAGAGMGGLAAAAEARRLGAEAVVLEKLDQAGGSMRLSSGVIWRHRDFDRFRAECPEGDERLQRLLFERLDDDIDWLESLGAPVTERDTGNPLTTGTRFDPEGLTETLAAAAGHISLGSPLREPPAGVPLVLSTGGFGASRELLAEYVTPYAQDALIRAAPGSTGDGLRFGLAAGGRESPGLDQVYARAMPAPPARVEPGDFVRLSQLYATHAAVTNERGEGYEARTWSETDVAQWQLRQPCARAWFRVPVERLGERVRERTVADMIDAAEEAGAPVRRGEDDATVETVAGVTTTLGGLAIDEHARLVGADGRPVAGLVRADAPVAGVFACGADAGGIATGGYASGLAAALVFGRIATRAALGETP
jgi:succinate dehydrogenase/fumarate reductase flavoprotein subunit